MLSLLTALSFAAFNAGLPANAAPIATHSSTGQALALRTSLRALVPLAARHGTFKDLVGAGPQDLHHASDGRFIYDRAALRPGALLKPSAAGTTPQVNEAVQTYDVFSPPPGFTPTQGTSLTPTNLTPVWTADETMLVFSSNRTASGTVGTRFHIWAIPVNGGTPLQLTDSSGATGGGEFFPALSNDNNSRLAFTSDANTPGVQNLYSIPVPAATVAVATLTSPTNRANLGFAGVQRPTFVPGNSDELVFSAFSTAGTYQGHSHLYFLYFTSGGYDPNNLSLPAKLTDGPADDTDPAYSQDGQLIAFASNAAGLTATGNPASADPNTSVLLTSGAGANRSIFLAGGGGRFGFGTVTNTASGSAVGRPVTLAGTDNFGPAWSSLRRTPYTNPAPGYEYLAFSRGTSPTSPHDIYYLQVLQNTDAGGETNRSNEAATTPEGARTPIDQVNAGDATGTDVNGAFGSYVPDTFVNLNGPQPFTVNGGTAAAITPAPVVNTVNDPGTPPAIYLTSRTGTFSYTFGNLTPGANYRVRLHLSDPKDTAAGQRVFNVTVNGATQSNIDIVGQAQSAPGRIDGLVADATSGTPIAATITVTDASGNPVTTTPSPLTSAATTSADPNGGGDINYNGALAQGTYTVTVTPASISGYSPVSQTVTVSSGAYTRLDFPLAQGSATINGTVKDTNGTGVGGIPVSVIDDNTGLTLAAGTTSNSNTAPGTFSLKVPPTPAGDKYDVTVSPPYSAKLTTQTQQTTVTAATPVALTFTLQSGAITNLGVGTLGGLVTNATTGAALSGATVRVIGGNNTLVAIFTTGPVTTAPAAPSGDGKPVNYLAFLPVNPGYTLVVTQAGFARQQTTAAVVNTPASGTVAANAFTRADFALVTTAPAVGQNTAVVVEYGTTVFSQTLNFGNGTIIPAGSILVAFNPVSGDPPIVEGIEILSDNTASVSSGYGALTVPSFFQTVTASSPPQIDSAIGGVGTAPNGNPQGQVTIQFHNAGTATPTSYNLYRSPAAPTTTNRPPASNASAEVPYITNVPFVTLGNGELQVTDTNVTPGAEYYYQLTAVFTQTLTPEKAATNTTAANPAVKLNTDDNAGQASPGGNAFDDIYPTWSPFLSVFSIAYSSNRSVTYNNPTTGTTSETAISVARGGKLTNSGAVGAAYAGILVSQVVNLDPPTLLPYSGNEIVHVADSAGNTTRYGITPGQKVTFTVRLSSREAGIDNTGGVNGGPTGAQVYLQIKNPNSKYQDSQGLEHKVFARDYTFRSQRNNPNAANPLLLDSGSSTQLINGGGYDFGFGGFGQDARNLFVLGDAGFNRFTGSTGVIYYGFNRGAVGGTEDAPGAAVPGPATNGVDTISIGRDGGGVNGEAVFDSTGKPVTDPDTKQIVVRPPGSDPNLFIPWGPEFECQVVNPAFATSGSSANTGDTGRGDFRDPYFLAGVDDQQPFSGEGQVRRTTNTFGADGTLAAPAEWLQMTRVPDAQQDGQGGTLYTVTWTTPTSGSDYYMDVIAFDKATPPGNSGGVGSNWRIYDNIWGFSTAASIGNSDILVVSDYALGQKFAATTFGGQRGLLNLVPKLFGAESYVTDIDVNLLPNAVYRHTIITGANADNPNVEVNFLGSSYSPTGRDLDTEGGFGLPEQQLLTNPVFNGLGVGSYYDRFIDDGGRIDNVPAVRSQQYSIWRTLSRGPVPASVYQAYTPTRQTQPAVSDTSGTTKLNIASGSVAVANRCIVWIAPFTGDVLAGAGTLADTATQTSLRAFVAAGGRLCVSGEDVGSTLTQNGTTNNAAGGFLSDVLNATLATPNGGTHIPAVNAAPTIADNRISNTPGYDGYVVGNYPELNPGITVSTVAPGSRLLRISNNFAGNIFSSDLAFTNFNTFAGNWRTDGSLDQLGPYIQPYPVSLLNSNAVVSAIDTITPNKTAHTDITLAPFTNPIPLLDNGNDAAASGPGGIGLIYTENPITASGGTGSKVVYATFGLEGLSTEYYKVTSVFKPNPVIYNPRNQRQSIIHNIVNYLRTGSIAGTIRSTSGNGVVGSGVAGVTVYLQSAFGNPIPGRATFSATTDSAGNYRIDGIEPGSYTLAAYRTGFIRATSNPGVVFTVEGDTLQQASLTLVPSAPGSLSGKVTDTSGNAVAAASVIFTSTDGQIYSTTTDTAGNYSLPNVQPGTYTGTASKTGFGTATQTSVTVASNTPLTVNFTLTPGPGAVTGRVVDTSGNPIPSATVFFTSGSPAVVAATATTDATGTYTIASITAGTYNATATATGFGTSAPISVVVVGSTTTTAPDITLGAAANGTLGGLVTATGSTTPVSGVTLTITNTGTGQAISPSPVTTATSTAASDGGQINYGPISVAQGTYTVTATKGGISAGTQTVTVAANTFTRVDFTGINGLPPLHTFAAGLNFLSLPYDYSASTIDSVFGVLNTAATGTTPNGNRSHVAVWNPLLGQYALDPTAPADALRLGIGYWVFLKNPVSITTPGTATGGAVSVALHPSWNQIGVPSTSAVPVSSLSFVTGTTTLSFADAAGSANHVVSATLYRYDGANYQPVSASDSLQPYQAYWIKVFVDTTVRIPTGR